MIMPDSVEVSGKMYLPHIDVNKPVLYRVNHDRHNWRDNLPEVFRLDPDYHVIINEDVQWLWRNMNPQLTDDQFCALFDNKLAFTNGTGFPGHANYILGTELDKTPPRFDQMRVCGGAILSGYKSGKRLYINYIDTRKPLPSAKYVMSQHLYFEAVNIDWTVNKAVIRPFKGGWHEPVYVPILGMIDNISFVLDYIDNEYPGLTQVSDYISPYIYP